MGGSGGGIVVGGGGGVDDGRGIGGVPTRVGAVELGDFVEKS